MKILVIPGSLRKGSYNKLLAKTAIKFPPENVEFVYRELNDLPMFNEDLESDLPGSVKELLEQAKSADALIISTPEYNNTIPAPVANLMHWLSRSYSKPFILDKPLGIMGASDGRFGTVRSQNQLMLMATIVGFRVNSAHRLPVLQAQNVFDDNGEMTDEETRKRLNVFIDRFVEFVTKVKI